MDTLEAITLARKLMDEHGLQGWVVRYSPAVRQFGACYHYRKCILLSKKLVELNTEDEVRDTILHEIAHALAGHSAGHGAEWRKVCIAIGARPVRCYSSATVKTPDKTVLGTCPNCAREVLRYRRRDIACGTCCKKYNGGKYSKDYAFTWRKINN